jgi:hypothetical protein
MSLKFVLFLSLAFMSIKNKANDTLGFISPVDHKVILTGNFMELRSNHFHSGIDIKSRRGVSGDVIKSVQDGYISRIRITSGSYGNALYIDHPNGYTSVYAHLSEFIPEVSQYLEEIQYAMESFEVDIYLPDSLLAVVKGQEIGKMGNTGNSFGPHLHFEIRETKTEIPVNPELYGFGPQDNKAPILQSLYVYEIDDNDMIGKSEAKYFNTTKDGYHLHQHKLKVSSSKVGLGLQMYDTMNGGSNKNGIYSYRMFVDDSLQFEWKADAFSFNDNRKINAFMDYDRYKKLSQKIYLLFRQKCSDFLEAEFNGNGIIDMTDGTTKNIIIEVIDIRGNKVSTSLEISKSGTDSSTSTSITCSEAFQKRAGKFNVKFEEGAFYSPQNFKITSGSAKVGQQECSTVTIGDRSIPVSKYYTIETAIPSDYDNQWTFINKDSKGRYHNFGADTLDGKMYCRVDEMGTFYMYKDKVKPKLQVINLQSTMKSPWKVKITDNLIPDGRQADLSYRATVNGKWIRMQYDLKNDLLIFDDFERLGDGPYRFVLELSDNNGNIATLKRTIG